jgi:hypothetical protein
MQTIKKINGKGELLSQVSPVAEKQRQIVT